MTGKKKPPEDFTSWGGYAKSESCDGLDTYDEPLSQRTELFASVQSVPHRDFLVNLTAPEVALPLRAWELRLLPVSAGSIDPGHAKPLDYTRGMTAWLHTGERSRFRSGRLADKCKVRIARKELDLRSRYTRPALHLNQSRSSSASSPGPYPEVRAAESLAVCAIWKRPISFRDSCVHHQGNKIFWRDYDQAREVEKKTQQRAFHFV